MKLPGGSEDQKKIAAVAGFILLAGLILYFELRDPNTPPPSPIVVTVPERPAARGTGAAAKTVGTTAGALDPTLHMEAMRVTESVEYSGTGRNIFSANSAPAVVAIPKPVAPVRPVQTAALAPRPVVPTGPPPPPKIDLKFFGTETMGDGKRQAFLLHGDDVFLAAPGEVVMRRYRVVSVGANSVQVEDIPNNNTQTLPLVGQ